MIREEASQLYFLNSILYQYYYGTFIINWYEYLYIDHFVCVGRDGNTLGGGTNAPLGRGLDHRGRREHLRPGALLQGPPCGWGGGCRVIDWSQQLLTENAVGAQPGAQQFISAIPGIIAS